VNTALTRTAAHKNNRLSRVTAYSNLREDCLLSASASFDENEKRGWLAEANRYKLLAASYKKRGYMQDILDVIGKDSYLSALSAANDTCAFS